MPLPLDVASIFAKLLEVSSEADPADSVAPSTYMGMIESATRMSAVQDYSALVGISHMVYGWMPRMLNLHSEAFNTTIAATFWNETRRGEIAPGTLDELIHLINNSIVGTSKLLHFIEPERFPILDARVIHVLRAEFEVSEADTTGGFYRDYTSWMRRLVADPRSEKIQTNLIDRGLLEGGESRLRAIELCLWIAGRT